MHGQMVHDLLKVVSIWTNNREVFTIGINLPGRFFDRHRAALRQPRHVRTEHARLVDVNDVTYGNTERARKADHGRPKCNDPDDKQSGTNQELGYSTTKVETKAGRSAKVLLHRVFPLLALRARSARRGRLAF